MKATTSTPIPNSGDNPSAITPAPNTRPAPTISFHTPAPSARLASGTPTATALKDARNGNFVDLPNDNMSSVRPKAVVLITDGITGSCDGGQAGAVTQIERLFSSGIKTYAIGFGGGASPKSGSDDTD